jgi:hypothetical protein
LGKLATRMVAVRRALQDLIALKSKSILTSYGLRSRHAPHSSAPDAVNAHFCVQ